MMDRDYIEQHDILDRYRRNQLTPEMRIEFEEYILDKPDLIEQLELDMLFESGLQGQTAGSLKEASASSIRPRGLFFAASAAFSLLAASVVLNFLQNSENRRLTDELARASGAQPNIQILDLPTVLSDGGSFRPVGTLLLDTPAAIAIFNVQLPFPEEPRFRVLIRSHPEGREILVLNDVEPHGEGDLVFSLPLALFEPGNYYVEVSADGGEPLRIPFAAGEGPL